MMHAYCRIHALDANGIQRLARLTSMIGVISGDYVPVAYVA
jgi:hypothetical protein